MTTPTSNEVPLLPSMVISNALIISPTLDYSSAISASRGCGTQPAQGYQAGWVAGCLCVKRLMNSQARPSHSFFQWVSPQLLFWAFGFLNVWYGRTGVEDCPRRSRSVCLSYTFFSFQLYNLALTRNSHISNCFPELSLAFPVHVRYYGLPQELRW